MLSWASTAVNRASSVATLVAQLTAVEAQLSINQTIARYCRALDWLDESLLRTCYTADAYINYGFYKGSVEGFFPVVMEIERAALHRSHFLSNVAIQLEGSFAEVECYGIATSTLDGNTLNIFGGRYLNRFQQIEQDWKMSRSEYVLDHHFSTTMPPLGDAMGELQSGTGLDSMHPLFRSLYPTLR